MKDGSRYSPLNLQAAKVCTDGEFPISVIGLDHGHIYGMVENMLLAGANIVWVWDRDAQKIADFLRQFPQAEAAPSKEAIYECPKTKMLLCAAIPCERAEIGAAALRCGKHYMSDKPGFTESAQLELARILSAETALKWSVCFGERLQSEGAIYAGELVERGAIGKVVQVMCIAPHRLAVETRPGWFFRKEQNGGILCDIGSHQIDQLLFFTGSSSAKIVHSQVGNFANPKYPELEDFGTCTLELESGASGYARLDWFTPEGLGTWGDGRLFLLGTEGYIEVRKYTDIAASGQGDQLFLVNGEEQKRISCAGQTGFPYFGQLIRDCLEGSDLALPQQHVFEVSRLAIEAEQKALRLAGFR